MITPRKVYTEADYEPIVTGQQALPNPVTCDLAIAVADIGARGHMMKPRWGYSLQQSANGMRKAWTQFFLYGDSNMGGLDGKGYALIYGSPGRIVRFAICEHEKVEGAGANHSRGWHPGHCKKCGMDMTIDSGD